MDHTERQSLKGILATLVLISVFLTPHVEAFQRRDFLTIKEVERLQEAQRIDLRISVLVFAADRRFAVLGVRAPIKRSERDWGEEPSGTREEVLRDIDRIIMKAVDDIDYAASQETASKFFRNGFSALKKSCDGYDVFLRRLLDESKDDRERGVILNSLERCAQVSEAFQNFK